MLKMATVLTHPTPADISPTRPESAKTDSLPQDAPFHGRGRSEQLTTASPSLLGDVSQGWPGWAPTERVVPGTYNSLYLSL